MKIINTIAIAATCLAGIIPAHAAFDYGVADDYNVYVFDDFRGISGSTQSRIAVGGRMIASRYEIIKPEGHPYADTLSHDWAGNAIVVGGDTSYSFSTLHYGDAMLGGGGTLLNSTFNRDVTVNGKPNVSYTTINGTFKGSLDATEDVSNTIGNYQNASGTVTEDFNAAKSHFVDYSNSLSNQATTGTASRSADNPYLLTLTGDGSSDLQIFNLSSDDLANAYDISLAGIGNASSILINIDGNAVNLSDLSAYNPGTTILNSDSLFNDHGLEVMYNFYNADTVTVGNVDVYGTILAPNATVTANNGNLYGRLISNGYSSNADFHFKVYDTTPAVPEPSTYLMMTLGLGIIGYCARRRIHRAT